MSEQVLM